MVDGRVRVDLPYEEDSRAEVDMNVVATDTGTLVEIQGTGEGATFPRSTLDKMLDAALAACEQLFVIQREALELPYPGVLPDGAAGEEGVRKLTLTRPAGRQPQPQEAGRTAPRARCGAGVSGMTLVSLEDVAAVRRGPRDGRDVRGERVGQGARRVSRPPAWRRWPTIRVSRWTR